MYEPTQLRIARECVEAAENTVLAQRKRVAQLEALGEDTKRARDLLDGMESVLRTLREELAREALRHGMASRDC